MAKTTWQSYQLWMMGLSITLFVALVLIEFFMRKFDIMHVIYNQMLRLKKRKLICFNSMDVTGNYTVNSGLFMMTRLTVILVLGYLWQFCVIETYSMTNAGFPAQFCAEPGFNCFEAELKWNSFVNPNDMTAIDCAAGEAGYTPASPNVIVSCFKEIPQNAANWLQNVAIANALGLLMTRLFEVLVWVSFQSLAGLITISILGVFVIAAAIILVATGYFSEFINSWLGFVSTVVCPYSLYLVRSVAIEIRRIKRLEIQRIQEQTKADFQKITEQFSTPVPSPTTHRMDSANQSLFSLESTEGGLRQRLSQTGSTR